MPDPPDLKICDDRPKPDINVMLAIVEILKPYDIESATCACQSALYLLANPPKEEDDDA